MTPAASFRDLSLRHKLNAIILVTCAAGLLLVAASFVGYEAFRFRRDLVDQYTTLAGVLATNSAAAIAFDDPQAGRATLAALGSDPHVVHASLSGADGFLFAEYLRDGLSADQRDAWARQRGYESWAAYQRHHHATVEPYRLGTDHLDVFAPVLLDGETVGKLFIQIDMQRLYTSFRDYTLIVGVVLVAALGFALLLSQRLQRIISGPILSLAGRMRQVSTERDYAVRVESPGGDEIGALFEGFNEMLAQIERRDRDLVQLAAAVEQAPDGIAVLDRRGAVLQVNRAFQELTGWDAPAARALSLADLYPVTPTTVPRQEVFDGVCAGTPWQGAVKALRADGGEYDEFCSMAPITGDRGEVVSVLLLKRDITRELQMEERVRESQKLQALGTLAGGIAHDFNNLMSPVVAYSELLLDQAEPGTKTHTRLERITEAAIEASALVKQILAFSRPGSEARQPLTVQSLVKECVKLFHMALPPDLEVDCQVESDAPPVVADPSQLHQVLMNLLTNAKHAMADGGGRIRCRVFQCQPAAEEVLERPEMADAPCVCITVQDDGHGMSPEVRERIFEPFYSTKGLGEGTGMGLAVVRGVVDDHGGAIRVESEPGAGATFRVYLPVAPAVEEETAEPHHVEPVAGNAHVLFLEADAGVREPLCQALGMLGYRAEGVADAAAVLERLGDGPGHGVDALVVDVHHLDGNGAPGGLLARVRAVAPELPLLVSCDGDASRWAERLAGSGPHGLVEKPLSPLGVGAALQEICTTHTETAP